MKDQQHKKSEEGFNKSNESKNRTPMAQFTVSNWPLQTQTYVSTTNYKPKHLKRQRQV